MKREIIVRTLQEVALFFYALLGALFECRLNPRGFLDEMSLSICFFIMARISFINSNRAVTGYDTALKR